MQKIILLSAFFCLWAAGSSVPAPTAAPHTTTLLDQIKISLTKNPDATIEQILADLKASQPDYFSNFALVHQSLSVQQASQSNPRVILFSPAGGSSTGIAAFNGSSENSGHKTIELIQWDEKKRAFELFEVAYERSRTVSRLRIDGPNPTRCLSCHGTDPRPNWEAYDFWPGVVGSLDDRLGYSSGGENYQYDFKNQNPVLDQSLVEAYKRNFPEHSRYRFLDLNQFSLNKESYFERSVGAPRQISLRPNAVLTETLSLKNLKRVRRILEGNKWFYHHRPSLVAAWLCPQGPTQRSDKTGAQISMRATREIFAAMGLQSKQLTMNYRPEVEDSFLMPTGTEGELSFLFAHGDADLEALMNWGERAGVHPVNVVKTVRPSTGGQLELCEQIRTLARTRLSLLPDLSSLTPISRGLPQILSQCMECHGNPKDLMFLPLFDVMSEPSMDRLRQEILRRVSLPHFDPEVMPPGAHPLAPEEIDLFEMYLSR